MQRWCYQYHGLNVESDIEIPELDLFAAREPFPEADVLITLEKSPASLISDDRLAISPRLPVVHDREFGLRIPQAADFRVQAGRRILISPSASADFKAIRQYLLGSVWAAVCYQRGIFVVHASAVRDGNAAVMFCGASGHGKSTTAAFLSERGFPVLNDDLSCCSFPADGGPQIFPSSPRIKLWADALQALGLPHNDAEACRVRTGKFRLRTHRSTDHKPLPVAAVYLLEWGEPGIRRLSGLNALRQFLHAATYRGRVIEELGELSNYSRHCVHFLEQVPVFQFTRHRSVSEAAEATELLTGHISGLRL